MESSDNRTTARLGQGFDRSALGTPAPVHHRQLTFQVVPPNGLLPAEAPGLRFWQVVLSPVKGQTDTLALELHAPVVLGSSPEPAAYVDINLAHWGGYEHGVSRRHLMLRPTPSRLYALDMHSTNGTYVNGLPLGVGWAYAIQDGDLLTLGSLHIRVAVVQRP